MWGVAAVVAGLAVCARGAPAPSFLVIKPDDFYGQYGEWGLPPALPPDYAPANAPVPTSATPHVNRLIAEGVTFSNVVAAATKCSPSRFAELTGRYNSRNAVAVRATAGGGLTDVRETTCRLGEADRGERKGRGPCPST